MPCEKQLLIKAKRGDEKSQNEILMSNLKFVYSIAVKYRNHGFSIDELMSEGTLAMLHAIKKFNVDMDVKFITYAGYWIRYFMSDMIRRSKNRNIIEQSTDDLFYDRYLNKDEEESSENVAYNISKIPTFEIEDVHMAFDKDKNLLDKLMSVLNKREKEIIENYFGIGNKEKKNLEEIGTIFKISTERVRQIKDMSLIKMKSEAMLID